MRVFRWVGNESVVFCYTLCQELPTFVVLLWIFFSNQFSDTITCSASPLVAAPVWILFFLCIALALLSGFFMPAPVFSIDKSGRIERLEHNRGKVLVWSHTILRGFLFVAFALGYRGGVPISCLGNVTIPCPTCWSIASLIVLGLATIAFQIARWVTAFEAAARVAPSSVFDRGTSEAGTSTAGALGPEGSADGLADGPRAFAYLPGDDKYWIRHAEEAARVKLWRRWSEAAELAQCCSDSVPALALWVHYVVLGSNAFVAVGSGNTDSSCSSVPALFPLYFGVMVAAVGLWRFWQLLYLRLCGPKAPRPVWVLRAAHVLLSPALFWAVAGYASANAPGMGCWSARALYLSLTLVLLLLAALAALVERTLLVIYVTPVADASSQTRLADTLIAAAMPAARKLYLRPPTRMYPHPHWGGAILYAPPDPSDAGTAAQ